MLVTIDTTRAYVGNLVISGFPGIGKSAFASKYAGKVSDSDSSKFPKDNFPANYMRHILENVKRRKCTLVSSHSVVRHALVELGVQFTLVYPYRGLKEEYMQRYADRVSPQSFIDMMDANWDKFIMECYKQPGCKHILLGPGKYLSDAL